MQAGVSSVRAELARGEIKKQESARRTLPQLMENLGGKSIELANVVWGRLCVCHQASDGLHVWRSKSEWREGGGLSERGSEREQKKKSSVREMQLVYFLPSLAMHVSICMYVSE